MGSSRNMVYHMEIGGEIAEYLDMPTLTRFGLCAHSVHWMATRVSDARARESFQGVRPVEGWGHGPYWKRLGDSLQPRRLILTYCGAPPDCTFLLGCALRTELTWFLEFEMAVAKAPNGTPCVGLVDARARVPPGYLKSGHVPRDMSRGGAREGKLAVSFSPETGRVFASSLMQTRPEPHPPCCCCTATLNWGKLGDSSMTWNDPVKAGLLIKDRQLIFYRGNMSGQWRSSGVILGDLPDEVIPAVFLSSFSGFARVGFLNLWPSPPDVACIHCDQRGHGLKSDWCACQSSFK
jgi:hypothetical protein